MKSCVIQYKDIKLQFRKKYSTGRDKIDVKNYDGRFEGGSEYFHYGQNI